MNQNLKNQLETLQNTFYDKASIENLLKENSFEELLSLYISLEFKKDKENMKLLRNLLSHLSQEPIFSLLFLFNDSPKHKELMEKLIKSENSQSRQLLANALSINSDEIYKKMKIIQNNNNNDVFFEYITVIFFQLADPESEIGLKILKLLIKLAEICVKNQEKVFYLEKEAIKYIANGVKHPKDVIQLRFMDLICIVSTKNEDIFLITQELLEESFEIYKKGDILVKLNAVEILSKLGDSKWTSDFLSSHPFFKSLMKEAFDINTEYYVQKYLVLLISKMISNETIKFDLNLKKNLIIFIRNSLDSKSAEENEGALEIIGNLLQKQQGIDVFLKDKPLLKDYLQFYRSTNTNLKKKFLNSFSKLFIFDKTKNLNVLKNIFAVVSDVTGKLAEQMSLESQLENDENLKESMNSLFNILYSPFSDYEIEALYILRDLIQYEFGLRELAKQQKSIEYLLQNYAKTKEIFDVKVEIRQFLNSSFKSKSIADPLVKEFSKKYQEAHEMENKGNNIVYYKTEAND